MNVVHEKMGFAFAITGRMTSPEFVALSTELFKDLTNWVAEASKDSTLSAADLVLLQAAMKVVERATYVGAELKADTAN